MFTCEVMFLAPVWEGTVELFFQAALNVWIKTLQMFAFFSSA